MIKRIATIVTALAIISGTFFTGVYTGYVNRPEVSKITALINTTDNTAIKDDKVDFSPFWKTWNLINEKFVPVYASSTTDQERVWGATEGLVASLGDPYSVFMPPQDAATFEQNISGSFGGVGMEVGMRNEILTVIAPLKGSPSEAAGIRAGDVIIKINDTPANTLSVEKAVSMIRGEIGTKVRVTIVPQGKGDPKEVSIVRQSIDIPTIKTELRSDGIFVIELYSFSANSPSLFRKALREFVNSGSDKLLLDLRGNPGGYLEAAVDMSSWFLPAGKTIVTENFGNNKEPNVYRSRGYDIFKHDGSLKFAILVDQGSASAAEIMAGALSESNIATLVGEKTFGKGSVQELINITPETSLKLTVARWLTPNGVSISKNGLMPKYRIPLTKEDIVAKRDLQKNGAIDLLLGREVKNVATSTATSTVSH